MNLLEEGFQRRASQLPPFQDCFTYKTTAALLPALLILIRPSQSQSFSFQQVTLLGGKDKALWWFIPTADSDSLRTHPHFFALLFQCSMTDCMWGLFLHLSQAGHSWGTPYALFT